MTRPRRIDPDEVWEALEELDGSVLMTAGRLECTPRHIYNIINEDEGGQERYQSLRRAARASRLDLAEDVVDAHVKTMDLKAATFELRQRGKDRGYGNKLEVGGVAGQPIEHSIAGISDMSPRDLLQLYREMTHGSGKPHPKP